MRDLGNIQLMVGNHSGVVVGRALGRGEPVYVIVPPNSLRSMS